MTERISKIIPWVGAVLVILNLLLLDFIWVSRQKKEPKITETAETTFGTPTPQPEAGPPLAETLTPGVSTGEACTPQCKTYIEEEISKAISSTPTKPVSPTPKVTPTPSASKVSYITIGSTGSTSNTTWTDISGTDFYFDLGDYTSAKAIRWEVSLQSYLSSDPAYVRLYDVTNKRGIDGSELTTRSSSFEYLQSGNLTIWRGNNLYRIQAKGSSGNVVNFTSPRLKIVLE